MRIDALHPNANNKHALEILAQAERKRKTIGKGGVLQSNTGETAGPAILCTSIQANVRPSRLEQLAIR